MVTRTGLAFKNLIQLKSGNSYKDLKRGQRARFLTRANAAKHTPKGCKTNKTADDYAKLIGFRASPQLGSSYMLRAAFLNGFSNVYGKLDGGHAYNLKLTRCSHKTRGLLPELHSTPSPRLPFSGDLDWTSGSLLRLAQTTSSSGSSRYLGQIVPTTNTHNNA